MPGLRDLQGREFQALSPEAKGIVFDRLAREDEGFARLSPQAQALVKDRLLGTGGPGLIGRTLRRVAEGAVEPFQAALEPPPVRPQPERGQAVPSETPREILAREVPAVTGFEHFPEGLPEVGRAAQAAATFFPPFIPFFAASGAARRAVLEPLAEALGIPETVEVPAEAFGTGFEQGIPPGATVPLPVRAIFVEGGAALAGLRAEQVGRKVLAGARGLRRPQAVAPAAAPEAAESAVAAQAPPVAPPVRPVAPPKAPVAAPTMAAETPPPRPSAAITGAAESAPPPTLTDPILKLPQHREVLAAAEDLFRAGGVARDPRRLVSDQVMDLLGAGRLDLPQLERVLAKHNIGFVEFGDTMFRPAIRDSARRLAALSVLERRIQALARTPGAKEELGTLLDFAAEVDEGVRASSWWRRADNVRRGLLVSQLATAVRNFETQVGRLGLDVLDEGLQGALQRTFGFKQTAHATEGFEAALNLLRGGRRAEVESVLSAFPREHDRLLMTYHADILAKAKRAGASPVLKPVDQVLGKAEDAVALLNTVNRFQEFLVRRSVFAAKLAHEVKATGQDLGRLIAENRVGEIPEGAVKAAVDKALEVTFAAQPAHGTIAAEFVRFVNKLPGATLAIPFPRFMMNALRFFYEFSPAGLLRLLSAEERAALAAGNMKVLSRAALGTAMLGAAYEFRGSKFAGEKWYEARLPDGRTVDLRPFNPFAAYLFVSDVLRRQQEGTLFRLEAKDVFMGVLSANVRAGTGLFLMDKVLSGLTELGTPEKAARALKGLAGETVSGFLVPLQQLTDVMAEYDQRLRMVRERRTEPFLGPVKAKIPGQAETLPPVHLPTRAAPLTREEPLLRQLTGLIVGTPKNPLERELDRLQFNRREVLPSTGEPEADLLIARTMGRLAERLRPIITGPEYRKLSDPAKSLVLQQLLVRIRGTARAVAEQENPQLFLKLRLGRIPSRAKPVLRGLLEQQGKGGLLR